MATAKGVNHVLHLLLTFLTCTFWGWVWLVLACMGGSYRCTKCGTPV